MRPLLPPPAALQLCCLPPPPRRCSCSWPKHLQSAQQRHCLAFDCQNTKSPPQPSNGQWPCDTAHRQTEGKSAGSAQISSRGCRVQLLFSSPSSPRVQTMSFTHGNSPAISVRPFPSFQQAVDNPPGCTVKLRARVHPGSKKTLAASRNQASPK